MNQYIKITLSVTAAAVVLVAGWYFLSPLFTSTTVNEDFPPVVGTEPPSAALSESEAGRASSSEQISTSTDPENELTIFRSGNFEDADNFHKGSGEAAIYRDGSGAQFLRLENFSVTNGPNLHVILTKRNPQQTTDSIGTADEYLDLGELKGNQGNQNYAIREEIDTAAYNAVAIYCIPFNIVFSAAGLTEVR